MGRHSAIVYNKQGKAIYPFCIESVAMSIPQVIACALINYQDKITLCYSGNPNSDLLKSLTVSFGVENYLQLEKIPLDSRHNAKIDYPTLIKKLNFLKPT